RWASSRRRISCDTSCHTTFSDPDAKVSRRFALVQPVGKATCRASGNWRLAPLPESYTKDDDQHYSKDDADSHSASGCRSCIILLPFFRHAQAANVVPPLAHHRENGMICRCHTENPGR